MSHNDASKDPVAASKRKANVEAKMELCLLSAFDANTFNAANAAVIESFPKSQTNGDSKRGKRTHTTSQTSETTNNVLIESRKATDDENRRGGKNSSRLQWLQNHNIMHDVMSFLDEINLFQLENTHSKMIGTCSIARQWSNLSRSDENKTTYAHKRWRPMNEIDAEFVVNEMQSTKTKAVYSENEKRIDNDSDCDVKMRDYPLRDDFIARYIGRKFAEEAIFIREREKEASRIYNFDHTPMNPDDIPISLTDIAARGARQHWCEWYDYRANSVNGKSAFVRLSLRDGSGRYWQGFRTLTTNYNTTFFRMQFNMRELIKDMRWTELESYLQFNDATYTSMQNRLKAMESFMRMTQLTVSIGGKLLVATGGCCPRLGGVTGIEKCYFHPRHYRLPLADTTKNDLQWMPYRICLTTDPAQNELAIEFDCDHADLPFMKAEDIGKPHACAHW